MKRSLLVLAFFGLAAFSVHADEAVLSAQRSLKELGFYRGAEDGTVNVLFKGALRRFQIHRGLTPTGELDAATQAAMQEAASESSAPATGPAPTASAPPREEATGEDDSVSGEMQRSDRDFLNQGRAPAAPSQPAPSVSRPVEPRSMPPAPAGPPPAYGGYGDLFRGTPYHNAPPPVQQSTLLAAQKVMARQRLYQGPLDGVPGVRTIAAIDAYQRNHRLRRSGRLDLETLAVMRLLPVAGVPVGDRRGGGPPPPRRAVRGIPLD